MLTDPAAIESPFFLMAPPALLIPLLLLATVATVIASQSIISGAFSVTQQAVQLGFLPRITLHHTSAEARGQVYAPMVNVVLLIAVVVLVLGFGSSSALAAAFGLAVTATMVLTTLMVGFVVFKIWRWNPLWAVPLYALLLALDLGLFAASATKFADGGWLPVVIAAVLVVIFATWRRGRALLRERLSGEAMEVETFLASTAKVPRVPGAAVFLTSNPSGIPPALLHNLKHNHILHRATLLVTVETARVPEIEDAARTTVEDLGHGVTRVILRFGFVENPDIPAALTPLKAKIDGFDPVTAAYFLSRQTLIPSDKPGMPMWQEHMFAAMVRNSETSMSYFNLPSNRVVELGSQIAI